VHRADNLARFMCQLSINSGSLNFLEPSGPVQAVKGLFYLYLILKAATIHTPIALGTLQIYTMGIYLLLTLTNNCHRHDHTWLIR
jgi:hypothetical protein